MRKTLALAILALLTATAIPKKIEAQEQFVEAGYTTKTVLTSGFTPIDNWSFYTAYGQNFENWSFDIRANWDLEKRKGVQEVDFNFSFPLIRTDLINTDLYAGYFIFPNSDYDNPKERSYYDGLEAALIISTSELPVNIDLYVAHFRYERGENGNIVKGRIRKSFNVTRNFSTEVFGRIVYNNEYFNSSSGFSHSQTGLNLTLSSENISVTGSLTYQHALNKETFGDMFMNQTYGGLSAKFKF
ncbi:hypothetical protein ACFLTH_08005 [Bacteroidota bacterium]